MTTLIGEQYLRIKKQFPDIIVFFRLGDFYETFDDDAKLVSSICNIVLTGRGTGTGNRVPLAGVPYYAVKAYIAKLIQAGHKVAIVEQLGTEPEGPKAGGFGTVTRGVARMVAPKRNVLRCNRPKSLEFALGRFLPHWQGWDWTFPRSE